MTVETIDTDVVVVGAGPAGLALASELIAVGIQTLVVAPDLSPWPARYGLWADEVAHLDVPLSHTWDEALVSFPRRESVVLQRQYGRVDSAELFRRWSSVVEASDAFVADVVASALFSGDFHEIQLRSGRSLRARQVFDASGHRSSLTCRDPTSPAFQVAFGANVVSSPATVSQNTMGLMLWDDGVVLSEPNSRVPAFYYDMHESGKNTFTEYTVLSHRPLLPVGVLERALRSKYGSDVIESSEFERCIIPMGHAVPDLDQVVVGFGGAASMVHPATGYMIARILRTAPKLAEAYVGIRDRQGTDRARALWDVIWPEEQVRAHELFRFGLEALLTMSVEETHEFFAAFFALPDDQWRTYQSGVAKPREIAATMWAVFRRVGPSLKLKLARAGFGPHAGKLTRLVR